MKRIILFAIGILVLHASVGNASDRLVKWSQPIDLGISIDFLSNDIQGILVADDFQSDGRPVTDIRWWGSYEANHIRPPAEFWIGFWSDEPGASPSQPSRLLKSYHIPFEITHEVDIGMQVRSGSMGFEYGVDIVNDPFLEVDGEIYWLSIMAIGSDTWGWKTSPMRWRDEAVQTFPHTVPGPLPVGQPWHFPFQEIHDPYTVDMAFELTTPIPLPASLLLFGSGLLGLIGVARRSSNK